MSTLKVAALQGVSASSDAITLANDGSCTANITNNLSNRNKVINGSMICSQRGSSFTNVGEIYSLDRFRLDKSNTGAAFTITQSTTSPNGFAKSLKMDCTTADTSTAANEFVALRHKIEAQNLQDLAYGTSAAKALVLSFYVRSNVTGTYAITCLQRDNSSKLYARTYTINSADTWERKTISIPADTSGVINDDNGSGFEIYFPLIMGSDYTSGSVSSAWEAYANSKIAAQHGVNIGSNTSNEWYVTGVQLEVDHTGSGVATDFEHRSFAGEERLCKRYFNKYIGPVNINFVNEHANNKAGYLHFPYEEVMRVAPTVTFGSNVTIGRPQVSVSQLITTAGNIGNRSFNYVGWPSGSALGSDGDAYYRMILIENDANSTISCDAEL